MKRVTALVVAPALMWSAGVTAAAPNDPFDAADSIVRVCSAIFPVVALLVIVALAALRVTKRRQGGAGVSGHVSATRSVQTSPLATASLVTGVATWLILPVVGAIAAVATGHLARKQIRAHPEQFSGSKQAMAGLALGYAQFAAIALVAALMLVLAPRNPSTPQAAATTGVSAAQTVSREAAKAAEVSAREGKWSGNLGFTLSGRVLAEPVLTLSTRDGDKVSVYFYYLNEDIPFKDGRISYRKARDGGEVTIEGAFISETEASGTWMLTKGTKVAGGTATISEDSRGEWRASLEGSKVAAAPTVAQPAATWTVEPKPSSTRAPTMTPRPTERPDPTAVPVFAQVAPTTAPVALQGVVTLEEAIDRGLADIQITGMGNAASGASIKIVARPLKDEPLFVWVKPGTIFRSSAPGEQDMVARKLLGLIADERRYSPMDYLFLPSLAAGPQSYVVDAYCLNFHKDTPGAGTTFSVADQVTDGLANVFAAVDRVPGAADRIDAIQAAVWAITDNPTWAELADRGYEPDREQVRALLEEAGVDLSRLALFESAAATPLVARGAPQGGLTAAATSRPTGTTTVLATQIQKFFAPGPDPVGIAVAGDDLWIASGPQKRIYRLDRKGVPRDSFEVKIEGEFRGLTWDGQALRLLVRDWNTGNRVVRLDPRGQVLSSFTLPIESKHLAWDPAGRTLWTTPAYQPDNFLLQFDGEGNLLDITQVPLFGNVEGLSWAADGLWLVNSFGKWHRFDRSGPYLASADFPVELFARNPSLAWDERGSLWLMVGSTREIYEFGTRQAPVDAEMPPELRSAQEQARSGEGQLPLPEPARRKLPDSKNALLQVDNKLLAPVSVALDSVSNDTHESAVLEPGHSWSVALERDVALTLFLSVNGEQPTAYYGKVLALPGYEQVWQFGDGTPGNQLTPAVAATATPAPTARSAARAPTAAPTVRAAPTGAPTAAKPSSAAAACSDARVRITYPRNGSAISGVTNFLGTANVPDQAYYKFEYRPVGGQTWQFLTQFDGKTVADDKLMDFYTSSVAPGAYDFRLIAVDRSGNYLPPCEVSVTVQP